MLGSHVVPVRSSPRPAAAPSSRRSPSSCRWPRRGPRPRPGQGAAGATPARGDGPAVRLVLLIAVDQFRPDYLSRFGPPRGRVADPAHPRRGVHLRLPRARHHGDCCRPRDDAHRRDAGGQRHHRERVVRARHEDDRREHHRHDRADRRRGRRRRWRRRVAAASAGADAWRPDQAGLGGPAGHAAGAAGDRHLAQGSQRDPACRPRGRCAPTSSAAADSSRARTTGRPCRRGSRRSTRAACPIRMRASSGRSTAATHAYPAEVGAALDSAVTASPAGNELVLAMATAALEHEQLGQRGVTDVLTVSFSSNDSVGHTYGPESPEVRDMTQQTDRQLQSLLDEVDRRVGLAHTLIAFTADHGVAPLARGGGALRIPGGRFPATTVLRRDRSGVRRKVRRRPLDREGVAAEHLSRSALIASNGVDAAEVRRVAAEAAARGATCGAGLHPRRDPHGRRAARIHLRTHHPRLSSRSIGRSPRAARAALDRGGRRGDARHAVRLRRAHSVDPDGAGIEPGMYRDHVALHDLAPTLAAVLEVEPPSGAQGRVLAEALRTDRPTAPAPPTGTAGARPPAHRRTRRDRGLGRRSCCTSAISRSASFAPPALAARTSTRSRRRCNCASMSPPRACRQPVKAPPAAPGGSRVTTDGVLVIEAREYRTQAQNRVAARERLRALLEQAAVAPRPRHATAPSKALRASPE